MGRLALKNSTNKDFMMQIKEHAVMKDNSTLAKDNSTMTKENTTKQEANFSNLNNRQLVLPRKNKSLHIPESEKFFENLKKRTVQI